MNDLNLAFLKANSLPDVQANKDERALPIERVGIRGLRHPITIRSAQGDFPSVGNFAMDVALAAEEKGTHMSRFVSLLQEKRAAIDSLEVVKLAKEMLPLLEASEGQIELT
jgi:GTP cyclohydrolase I